MCVSKRLKVLSKCELLLSGFEKDVSGAPAMSSKKIDDNQLQHQQSYQNWINREDTQATMEFGNLDKFCLKVIKR